VVLRLFNKASAGKGRIGLAFGTNQIAVAVTRRDGAGPVLERCELLPLDPASGADAASLAVRAAALPRMPLSTVLMPDEYQLALVEAPEVPPAELRAAMRWRLKDTIDFKVEEAVIDVFDVPEQNRGGHGRMMYAVAARRSAVDRYAGALAGMSTFDVIDVPELCLRNLAALLPAAAAGVALLHLGETRASIVLVRGRTFYLSRQMDLAKSAGAERSGQAGARREREEGGRIDAGAVVLELQRSLDYYERHFDQPPITRIALSPAGPRATDLAQELGRETGFEVMTLDLNTLLPCAAPIGPESQAACLLAVGAALREEHRSL
jgi:MSHA biogenesis protein MshI